MLCLHPQGCLRRGVRVAPDPAESRGAPPPPQDPSPLRCTPGSSLRSPAEGEGHEGFPPPPDKDLESPSSTCLEALVTSRDSRARTRSPSPVCVLDRVCFPLYLYCGGICVSPPLSTFLWTSLCILVFVYKAVCLALWMSLSQAPCCPHQEENSRAPPKSHGVWSNTHQLSRGQVCSWKS